MAFPLSLLTCLAAATLAWPVAGTTGGAAAPPLCAHTRTLGLLAPLSGALPFLGREQRNWARLAVARHNARSRVAYRLVELDSALEPAQAAGQARELAANPAVLAVVGPAGSDEVPAAGAVFARARLGYVSGSATRAVLTNGANPGFFRVVPSSAVQASTVARYVVSGLHATRVLVVDDSSAYSLPLADEVARLLKARVTVERDSVHDGQTSYGSTIAKAKGKLVVFLPWKTPARAQRFGEQLRAKNPRATIFGADALYSADFKLNRSLVTMFAPDVRRVRAATPVVRDYIRRYGPGWSVLGAPTYVATQVAMAAVDRACRNGTASRAEVRLALATTRLRTSVLGIPVSFTRAGDLRRDRYWIYRVAGGKFVLVQ